jgi:EspG family
LPVLVPDFDDYTVGDVKDIRRAALLIEGRSVLHRWTDFEMTKHPHVGVEARTHYSLRTGQYLRVRKITGDAILGLVQQLAPSATVAAVDGDVVRFIPYKDDTMYLTIVDRLPDAAPGSVAVLVAPIPEVEEGGKEAEGS